ncbi:MAG: hypothetical protein K9L74_02900 [Candidatus Izimaplasma sp.]|nr:hypothetical protein [Candidatus Izimaplasma bacterium]
MTHNNNRYQYSQLETYKERIELKHLKTKTLVINFINLILASVTIYFFIKLQIEARTFVSILVMFSILFFGNLAFYSYDKDQFNNLKMAMYFNTFGMYIISLTLIILFQTPSIFTALFLVYAITAVYQDYKVMVISNFSLFLSGTLLVFRFPSLFEIPGYSSADKAFIVIFLVVFVLLISLSSFILIKRKNFFYNQLAKIKEAEVRNIRILNKIENLVTKSSLDYKEYYDSLRTFSKEISKKIDVPDLFNRKISLLEDLKNHKMSEILSRYPEYSIEEVNKLKMLELSTFSKIKHIGLKASKHVDIDVESHEIFSEDQFKSFRHLNDDHYVKIISFTVFYTLLKIDKPYLKALDEKTILEALKESEFYYKIDRTVLKIYLENNEVFETIVKDIFEGGWSYEDDVKQDH